MYALSVHVEVPDDETPVILLPPFPTHERYSTSFGCVVVKVIVIVLLVTVLVDAEPSSAGGDLS
jgi:hypothetical protein